MLKGLGLEVNIDHSSGPDEDFVRCSSAPVLIPGGGNYGRRVSQVARVLGGQVVCPLDPKSKNATTGQCLINFNHGAKRTCAPDGADGESKEPWASSSDTPQLARISVVAEGRATPEKWLYHHALLTPRSTQPSGLFQRSFRKSGCVLVLYKCIYRGRGNGKS